jgi:hypothetical protein
MIIIPSHRNQERDIIISKWLNKRTFAGFWKQVAMNFKFFSILFGYTGTKSDLPLV